MDKKINWREYPTHTVNLKNPYFGAGKNYGWDKDIDDLCGFGVNVDLLVGNGEVIIKTKYGDYRIGKVFAKSICDKYNSYYYTKGVTIAVIPRKLCDILNVKK